MFGATFAQAQPWIARFQQRLDAMVGRVESCFPGGVHIFLPDIYDPTDGVGDIHRAGLPAWPDGKMILAAYHQVIVDCAARHHRAHRVGMHDAFLGYGIHCSQFWREHYSRPDPHSWDYANLEDPNDRGSDAIRRLFLNALAGVLPRLPEADSPPR
jgi:hypothetical protein